MSEQQSAALQWSNATDPSVGEYLALWAKAQLGAHPFKAAMNRERLTQLLPDYFAMSQAFPYLQAGSQRDLIFDAIEANRDIPRHVELTSVVGNFLCWDETGGHNLVLKSGNAALPHILETERFHSNLFRKDVSKLLGRPIQPNYSPTTKLYLHQLYRGLSSNDAVVRCAHMVAFELHAAEMIEALWTTLVRTFDVRADDLEYFRAHVGGDDPAERYHGEMTSRLISELVPIGGHERFLEQFESAYSLNIEWCRRLASLNLSQLGGRSELTHNGQCHCGRIKFRVQAPTNISAVKCNCSICEMSGFLHLLVPENKLRIDCGDDHLSTYRFNKQVAQHTFCRICGVKPFYRPRSDPSGFSVNVRCLDKTHIKSIEVKEFDGQNWEQAISSLTAERDPAAQH
jgi:hypothetical protein